MKDIFILPSLRELYSRPYDQSMREWRRLGAIDKAAHILDLMSRNDAAKVGQVLEVGCGTGDVMRELARRGFGQDISGVEIGSERSQQQSEKINGRSVAIEGYDGQTLPFTAGSFDFVYATQVLEHVLHERQFLYELRRVSKGLVYVELPLELFARTRISNLQNSLSLAGHIKAYSLESFLLKLETSGLKVLHHQLNDHSPEIFAFQNGSIVAKVKRRVRGLALKFVPGLAQRLFTYHCGALYTAALKMNIC
ncbi:Methyltransferase domain-containing protein [Yoonia rosea]|uniref:Methyltransferase domain-containing protein n=1 Tax=Yoonia rosea TaxID=287098 RepID=A0A1R3WVM8_9RHOB|nr:class I SAM-dependent methyltransferase [Yoonia rosea]SIT81452.1 Methyltransferase domain-containing protein [Yoonia rosea]